MTRKAIYFIFSVTLVSSLLTGCQNAASHRSNVQDDSEDRITVGKVQREISIGMSGANVAQILGSPNIVSTDDKRREVWIYDKIATDTAYSSSTGGVNILVLGGYSSSGASSSSQRTLTVIIKFDNNGKVRDFAYNTSRF